MSFKRITAIIAAGLLLACGLVLAQEAAPTPQAPTIPEMIEIKGLSNLYDAAWFSHQMHTGYAAEGCASCHHHNTVGPAMPACSTCHSPAAKLDAGFEVKIAGSCAQCHKGESIKGPLSIPDLKAAYHNQCMGCHKEYGSGPLKCDGCHAKKQQ